MLNIFFIYQIQSTVCLFLLLWDALLKSVKLDYARKEMHTDPNSENYGKCRLDSPKTPGKLKFYFGVIFINSLLRMIFNRDISLKCKFAKNLYFFKKFTQPRCGEIVK